MPCKEHQLYITIEKAITFATQQQPTPSFAQIATHIGSSEEDLEKALQQWAGFTKTAFLQFLSTKHIKQKLQQKQGLSSHININLELRTEQTSSLDIYYAIHSSSVG